MTGWTLDRNKYMLNGEVRKLRKSTEDAALADMAKGRCTWVKVWAMIDVALQTGLRVSELAALQIEDVAETELIVKRGKGGYRRAVGMGPGLQGHLREFLAWKHHAGEPTEQKAPLFVVKYRGDYRAPTVSTLQKQFKQAAKRAGLVAHYSIHACRHSLGTKLQEEKGDLRLTQSVLGHRSPTTTAVYTHPTTEDHAEALQGLWED